MGKMREQWESYRSDVIPSDAGSVQAHECRRAFICGAVALLSVINHTPLDQLTGLERELAEMLLEEVVSPALRARPAAVEAPAILSVYAQGVVHGMERCLEILRSTPSWTKAIEHIESEKDAKAR